MAQCRGLIVCFIWCVCAPFLTDAQIRLEKQTMTVPQKVTVIILLVQMQFNGPLLLFQVLFDFSLTS